LVERDSGGLAAENSGWPMSDSENWKLEQAYDSYPRIEAEFDDLLDVSLGPRGPDVLYDVVHGLGLPAGSRALDLGCGEGRHSIELARRFGFAVVGIDPVERHIELSNEALLAAAESEPNLRSRVQFRHGFAEAIPEESGNVDVVWCRDVLVHVAGLDKAYSEIKRVLREDGFAVIYQMFWGERMEPHEGAWLWQTFGNAMEAARPEGTESAIAAAGLKVVERMDLSSEWGEFAQDKTGLPSRRLLHAARLLRDPERYTAVYGRRAYEIKLADCLWHVYRMIGKLTGRVYLLSPV
jgi:SAM-dependent methyltransferase